MRGRVVLAAFCAPMALIAPACQCATDYGNRLYACGSDDECAPGHVCHLATRTCQSEPFVVPPFDAGGDADAGEGDGGDDAGPDAGPDAGADAGIDGGSDGGCFPAPESCDNGRDDDCDGRDDCADPDCLARACSSVDAGFVCLAVDAGSCACGTVESTLDTVRRGRSTVLEVGGRAAVLYYLAATDGGTFYAECQSGCSGPSPSWSTPVLLGSSPLPNAYARPVLRRLGAGVAACWRNFTSAADSPVVYGECAANCNQPASWASTSLSSLFAGGGSGSALAVLGNLRVIASENTSAQAVYAECTNACTTPAGWTTVTFARDPFGAAIALAADGGAVLRMAFFASNAPDAGSLYAECSANCGQASSWATTDLPLAYVPDMVLDRAGLPRAFYQTSSVTPTTIQMSRCIARPCTVASNWATSSVATDAGGVSAGVAADGRTFFLTNVGQTLVAGLELSDGGYAQEPLIGCAGAITSTLPAGYLTPLDRWRVSHVQGTSQRFVTQRP